LDSSPQSPFLSLSSSSSLSPLSLRGSVPPKLTDSHEEEDEAKRLPTTHHQEELFLASVCGTQRGKKNKQKRRVTKCKWGLSFGLWRRLVGGARNGREERERRMGRRRRKKRRKREFEVRVTDRLVVLG